MPLYAFDIDGTLIRSFIRDEPCQTCGGTRKVAAALPPIDGRNAEREGRFVACPECVANYDTVQMLPGRAGALWRLSRIPDACFALVTNQAGVAFGYQTKQQVGAKLALVTVECAFFFGRPFTVHIAFGHPKATIAEYRDFEMVSKRKPSPVMLYDAMSAHRMGKADTMFVGDMDSDEACATAAGVRYVHASEFFGDTDRLSPESPPPAPSSAPAADGEFS